MRSIPLLTSIARCLGALALLAGLAGVAAPALQASTAQHAALFLPLVLRTAGPEQLALERINRYRALAGARLIQLHPALIQAARRHAGYDIMNASDPAAWAYGPHGEVAGKPGFSGRMPGDRAVAAGYPALGGWEVMNALGEPIQSVDSWMGTVYHRLIILDPRHEHFGYGRAQGAAGAVDVADFGHATEMSVSPGLVVYPASAQGDVPLFGVNEAPSALPAGASMLFGYPVTIQPIGGSVLVVSQAVLCDSHGSTVALYPNPANCGTACYALLPTQPLRPASTYTAHVAGSVDGVPFDKTWSFATIAGTAGNILAQYIDISM